jgi:uncharacterized integral membrane protein
MADEHSQSDGGLVSAGNGGPVVPGEQRGHSGVLEPNGGGGKVGGTAPGAELDLPDRTTGGEPARPELPSLTRSRASGVWVGLTFSAVVLLFLLIFILQNNVPSEIRFLGLNATLPLGIALLFAAALGILLVAIPGYLRILQLRRAARRREVS